MNRKTLKVNFAVSGLIGRGLSDLGADMVNTVECSSIMGRAPMEYTLRVRSDIRNALESIGKIDRAWALDWLRFGVQEYRRRMALNRPR